MNVPEHSPFARRIRNSIFFRITSMVVSLIFLLSGNNVAFAQAEYVPAMTPLPPAVHDVLPVDSVGVAIDVGTIRNRFAGDNGMTIIHLQDAHCNYEAQLNIHRMLQQLTEEWGIQMISVEGAEGVVDTSWFRAFPDAEIRKEVADYFMRRGELTGAEFFSITSDYDGMLFGAETREYYVENLRAFTEIFPYRDGIKEYLKGLKAIAGRVKSVMYSPALREVDRHISSFQGEELELADYARYLRGASADNGITLRDLANFSQLLKTLKFEDKIDFDIVDNERKEYIDLLNDKLDREEMTELVTKSVRFKKGHIKPVDFYSHLRELARVHEIPIAREYPNLFHYYLYSKLYDGIDAEGLFDEIDTLERRIKDALFTDPLERDLDRYAEMIDMKIGLIKIELTNGCYDRFKKYSGEFSLGDVVGFLGRMNTRYNLRYSIDAVPERVTAKLPNMRDFYELAIKRDQSFIDNTLRKMEEEGIDRAVLIAGGFHTRGIEHVLKKKGVSFVVATPKITKVVDTPYIQVLTNQRTSLEDVLSDSIAATASSATSGRYSADLRGSNLLAPFSKVLAVELMLRGDGDPNLEELSQAIGPITYIDTTGVEQEITLDVAARDWGRGYVYELTRRWLLKLEREYLEGRADERLSERQRGIRSQVWESFRDGHYSELLAAFQDKAAHVLAVAPAELDFGGQVRKAFLDHFGPESSPGQQSTGVRYYRRRSLDRARVYDEVLRASFEEADEDDLIADRIFDIAIAVQVHEGLEDRIAALNADPVSLEERGIVPLAHVHPGTGRGRRPQMHLTGNQWRWIREHDERHPEDSMRDRLAAHESGHLDIYREKGEIYGLWKRYVAHCSREGIDPDQEYFLENLSRGPEGTFEGSIAHKTLGIDEVEFRMRGIGQTYTGDIRELFAQEQHNRIRDEVVHALSSYEGEELARHLRMRIIEAFLYASEGEAPEVFQEALQKILEAERDAQVESAVVEQALDGAAELYTIWDAKPSLYAGLPEAYLERLRAVQGKPHHAQQMPTAPIAHMEDLVLTPGIFSVASDSPAPEGWALLGSTPGKPGTVRIPVGPIWTRHLQRDLPVSAASLFLSYNEATRDYSLEIDLVGSEELDLREILGKGLLQSDLAVTEGSLLVKRETEKGEEVVVAIQKPQGVEKVTVQFSFDSETFDSEKRKVPEIESMFRSVSAALELLAENLPAVRDAAQEKPIHVIAPQDGFFGPGGEKDSRSLLWARAQMREITDGQGAISTYRSLDALVDRLSKITDADKVTYVVLAPDELKQEAVQEKIEENEAAKAVLRNVRLLPVRTVEMQRARDEGFVSHAPEMLAWALVTAALTPEAVGANEPIAESVHRFMTVGLGLEVEPAQIMYALPAEGVRTYIDGLAGEPRSRWELVQERMETLSGRLKQVFEMLPKIEPFVEQSIRERLNAIRQTGWSA